MIQHYIKIAWRVVIKGRRQYLLLAFGLSIGLTIALLIGYFIYHELSYDRFHAKKDHIYRLLYSHDNGEIKVPIFSATFLQEVSPALTGIENATRLNTYSEPVFTLANRLISPDQLIFTDPSFFDMFSFRLMEGDPDDLEQPFNIFVSKSFADTHFKNQDPVGKTLIYENEHHFTVKGIYDDFPDNSIFQGDLIASFSSREKINPYEFKYWYSKGTRIYLALHPKIIPEEFVAQVVAVHNKVKPDYENEANFALQPLDEIHLHSVDIHWDNVKKGDIKVVIGLGVLCVFILLICIINHILMHTALLAARITGMEIQKVIGANLWQLLGQTLFETLLTIFIACFFSCLFLDLLIPWFNNAAGTQLQLTQFTTSPFWFYILLGLITIFILIFIQPVFFILRLSLKPRLRQRPVFWKKTIVSTNIIVQFAFTVTMLIGSIILYKQIKLITEKKLGFDKEQLVVIENPWDREMAHRFSRFQNEILHYPFVKAVAGTRNAPLENINNGGAFYTTSDPEKWINAGRIQITPNLFEILGVEFIAGENFKSTFDLNRNSVIINEAAYAQLGVQEIIGREIIYPNIRKEAFTVVGVVKNIQHESAHEASRACVYIQCDKDQNRLPNIIVRLTRNDHKASMATLESVWKKLAPQWPFSFHFMDERINHVYAYEIKSLGLLSKMTAVAILISCLGIMSFSMLTIEQRTKEIGIRKVAGAGIKDILVLLNKNYVKWAFIGFLTAVPIAWYAAQRWLENFAYKIELSWWFFAAAGGLITLVAIMTLSWHSWRAAKRNPVEALRYE
ncbi:ABC transporter permease [Fulvivirgaceae bacterium BMA12]|uniref:ABC transporter permease n=1 Tax=Agaribacillus aureus TaxID=3051825 RepID=A0ABT8L9U8_9BACT|nr:ABC transporter permease [Fulvivirgaceae bacterium BMA12]